METVELPPSSQASSELGPASTLHLRFSRPRAACLTFDSCKLAVLWCYLGYRLVSLLPAYSALLLFLLSVISPLVGADRNVTIPVNSTQITYTPFLCNATVANPDAQCAGAWRTIVNSTGGALVSTDGPDPAANNIIPQMFLRIQAKTIFLQPSIFSNATANITVSESDITVSTLFNTSLGPATILNLNSSVTTMVAISYVEISEDPDAILEVEGLIITVDDDTPSSSILPTQTLPPSISMPTFSPPSPTSTPSPSPTPPPSPSRRRMIAEAVGLTVGLGLGLTALSAAAFYYWRRRRRERLQTDNSNWIG
ncbi:hypothetical protein BDQ17DRAFT_1428752 [Cyathus striatus]|nr:hypothetical protein BDQ17DRAFT_1428752 [Cyathus striatus]